MTKHTCSNVLSVIPHYITHFNRGVQNSTLIIVHAVVGKTRPVPPFSAAMAVQRLRETEQSLSILKGDSTSESKMSPQLAIA